jgi:ABC-type Fe3+/spermidine/putrescine transport system ATPase subunit
MTALLQAEDLARSFGEQDVFRAVTFSLDRGRHLAVLGPSGSGKTSLLRVFAGLDAPDKGKLWIDGQLVSAAGEILVPPHARRLAMVFQDLALWPTLSALENVVLGLSATTLGRRERRERAREMLDWCGLAGLATRRPAALSVGQQQRVAMARALVGRPPLLLLDEPFSSLDWQLKGRLIDELKPWCSQLGTTLLLVTHDPAEAIALCDYALVLDGGSVAEQGPWSALLGSPASPFLREIIRRGAPPQDRPTSQPPRNHTERH